MTEPTTTPDPTKQPDPAPPANRKLASPVVLRITDAEVLGSQLPMEDLSALGIHFVDSSDDSSGGPASPVRCESNYTKCESHYQDETKLA